LRFFLESEDWRFVSNIAHIGVYNKLEEDLAREITFRITEIKEEDLLPEDVKMKYKLYDEIFTMIDSNSVS
jgi:hypothetical protein